MFKVGDKITNKLVGWQAEITSERKGELELTMLTGPFKGNKSWHTNGNIEIDSELTIGDPTEEQLKNEAVYCAMVGLKKHEL